MNRRPLFLTFALCLLTCRSHAEGLSPLADNQVHLENLTGTVEVLPAGATSWTAGITGLPLEPGDQVRVGSRSEAEISAAENALWNLRPNTQAVIEHHEPGRGRISILNGALQGVVDKTKNPDGFEQWEFQTPSAVCAVRGTEFALSVSPEDGTRLAVFDGVVEMQGADGPGGPPPAEKLFAGQEGFLRRGQPFQRFHAFSERMKPYAERRQRVREKLQRVRRTWTAQSPESRRVLRERRFGVRERVKPGSQRPARKIQDPRKRRPVERRRERR